MLLTADQVATILNVSRTTVYKLARNGDLPATWSSGDQHKTRRFDGAMVRAYCRYQQQLPANGNGGGQRAIWDTQIKTIRERSLSATPWEQEFVESCTTRLRSGRELSEKQASMLARISINEPEPQTTLDVPVPITLPQAPTSSVPSVSHVPLALAQQIITLLVGSGATRTEQYSALGIAKCLVPFTTESLVQPLEAD